MKKIVLGFAACALIASSCQKNEITEVNASHPDQISFSASTSKAASNDLAALQGATGGFNVYATHKTPAVAFGAISNKAYKYDGGKWAWEGAPVMWPSTIADYPINFYAVYPKATWTLDQNLAGYSYAVVGTSAEEPTTTPANQVDVLAAQMVDVKARPSSSNVTLDFKHILSKIDFKIVPGAGTTVRIISIAIRNVEKTGTYSYTSNAWTVGVLWSNHFTFLKKVIKGLPFDGATSTETVASAMAVDNTPYGSLMLMPQNASANKWEPGTGAGAGTVGGDKDIKTMIEVIYRITDADGKPIVGFNDAATEYPGYENTAGTVTGALFVKSGFPLGADWASGKAYTYNLFLGTANSTGGNLVDNKFYDENGDQVDLTVKNPDGDIILPDKPVVDVNKPIGFTVSVTEWDASAPGGDQEVL